MNQIAIVIVLLATFAALYIACKKIAVRWIDHQLKKGVVGYLIVIFVCLWVGGVITMAIMYLIYALLGAITGGIIAWVANMLPTSFAIGLFASLGAILAIGYTRRESKRVA